VIRRFSLLVITALFAISSTLPVHALDPDSDITQQDFYSSNNVLFYDASALSCASSTPSNIDDPGTGGTDDFSTPKAITLTGANNAEKIMNFLLSQGFSVAQASGILGNLSVESGFSPTALNPTSGAYGIFQWLGGRLTNLKSYGGAIYTTLEIQLQFLMHELATTESVSMGIKKISSAGDAAAFWDDKFERSGGASKGERVGRANKIYAQWQSSGTLPDDFLNGLQGGNGGGSGGGSSDNPSCTASDGATTFGKDELKGYAFPISARKKSDLSTFGGALTSMPCNKNCHHDGTPAYDLGVTGYGGSDPLFNPNPIGAPVYAISDGTIVKRSDNPPGPAGTRMNCTQFTLHSTKDNHDWWYGHLALAGAAVTQGQEVTVGQLLGYVGNSTCADKTMPHLHIDSGGGRLSDRDSLVYSVVNGLYIQLPDDGAGRPGGT